MKIKLLNFLFQTYPVSEKDIPKKWIFGKKVRLFGKTIGFLWRLK